MVRGLVDDQGNRHEDQGMMNHMVKEYFTNLFTSERPIVDGGVLGDVIRIVTPAMNLLLNAPFQKKKFRKLSLASGI
jgi:hypothetical protein